MATDVTLARYKRRPGQQLTEGERKAVAAYDGRYLAGKVSVHASPGFLFPQYLRTYIVNVYQKAMSTLEIYLRHAADPGRVLTADTLEAEGYSRSYAHVLLHRLASEGAAERLGPGRVRLVRPGAKLNVMPGLEPWKKSLNKRFKTKATGFSVLPRRYSGPRPEEFLVPPSKLHAATKYLRGHYPALQVVEAKFVAGDQTVCLYPARVRGKQASVEEALLHVYRHAPREQFVLALQAVLMKRTHLNWRAWRDAKEWPELAGVFQALNKRLEKPVFPQFQKTALPDLSYAQLDTLAQVFTARGQQ